MSAAPLKIMIVDDEPPIRKLLRMGLSTQGYDILEAPNGKIALHLLQQEPALIIIALIPLALKGVAYRAIGAGALLRRNLMIYGVGGIIIPFIGIKAIDLVVAALHLV